MEEEEGDAPARSACGVREEVGEEGEEDEGEEGDDDAALILIG